MKNKAVKLTVAFIILSSGLLNISAFMTPLHGQKQMPTSLEFLVRTAQDPKEFISVWNTSKISAGSSASDQVRLPLYSGGTYNFLVDWGDMSNDTITVWNQAEVTHTYASEGVYTITITGTIIGWRFVSVSGEDRLKILEIQQWGCLRLGNDGSNFFNCENLELTATDNLNLTGTTSLYQTFYGCSNLGSSGIINGWDVSSVINMKYMFYQASSFNQPIGNWNVSSVTDMERMFCRASSFNQPIGGWDVSRVRNMESMFSYAFSFNQPIGGWDVSRVTNMQSMFSRASSFNQPIGDWNVSNVRNMMSMFNYVSLFNHPIGNWDVSSVTDMGGMFSYASSFNQPIGNWKVSSVTTMQNMFREASSFNQPIGDWDVSSVKSMYYMFWFASSFDQFINDWNVSSVTNMECMFAHASSFNQPLNNWDVSGVKNMYRIFSHASSFNQPLNNWDVSGITDMSEMFREASSFNQPIGDWNVSSVTTMSFMFYYASSFNQPIGDWNVSSVTTMSYMFDGVTLSTPNYDNLLLGWSQLNLYDGVIFHAGNSRYSIAAVNARQTIITNHYWTIYDGGLAIPGDFTLSSDAGTPDTDGSFTITWTSSDEATNYSVYRHFSYITEINENLTLLADEIPDLSLSLSGYLNGTYYFIVVAHNENGDTLSNCIEIIVAIPPSEPREEPIIPGYNLSLLLIGIILILGVFIKRRYR